MEGLNLISTFAEFKELKNIDRPTMMSVLEDVFRSQLTKMYGSTDNFDVIINIDKGDFEIWRNREVVETVEDPNTQISLAEVSKIDDSYEVGESYTEEVKLSEFGRRGILTLRQNLAGRIMDIEKANVYAKYIERVGEILVGEVYQVWKKEVLVLDEEGNELILPKSEQIPSDYFRKGDTVRAVVISVEMRNNVPVITLSRTAPKFLERLFEQDVPEIYDGLITIKKIVRIPGERAKVAVESYDDRIDPVGACVGVKGSRIHGIVRELRNENIDIINWTTNPQLLIQRALSPAKITSIRINEEEKRVGVYLKPNEVSLAIGKGGSNIKLAGMLIGYEIDVFREVDEDEEDVMLDEFNDEIDQWILDALKQIGCDTAKSVLAIPIPELIRRADLEEETVTDVVRILRSEFENDTTE
ncbi:MAG: transcription termination/antitermination protein NusA [Bacteroidales bacterium]|jgi:N utilization substance protein A|nr:transcription termination factor NusA [Bacteroidales bacterium]NLK80021.1 transcription termination/antitermination protein NusA [Bacteroidales bacterium]HKM31845.1 transcription termination factor NusA [Bacteroidales bacterium]HPX78731.1 transcription termination factor NusA [Bacteroidales bacterium]